MLYKYQTKLFQDSIEVPLAASTLHRSIVLVSKLTSGPDSIALNVSQNGVLKRETGSSTN